MQRLNNFLKFVFLVFWLGTFFLAISYGPRASAQEKLEVNFFWGQGCPHCEKAKVFLEKMQAKYPNIVINSYEVFTHPENQKLFQEFGQKYGVDVRGVPMTFIGESVHNGFKSEATTGKEIEASIQEFSQKPPPENGLLGQLTGQIKDRLPEGKVAVEGQEASQAPLTFTKIISLAVADSVNPCAMAVFALMLIAILAYNPKKRTKILWAGLAFILAVFLTYILYGLVIIKIFQLIQALALIRFWLYKLLGAGAIVLGAWEIKDFIKNRGDCKVVPRINKLIYKITSPKGAFAVGFLVTIFLLPCTIGPYIVAGGILSAIETLKTIPWLLLYNLVFVLPMLAIVLIIYAGFARVQDVTLWEAKYMKYFHLASGILMVALGILMILGIV